MWWLSLASTLLRSITASTGLVKSLTNLATFSFRGLLGSIKNPLQLIKQSGRSINNFLGNIVNVDNLDVPFLNTINKIDKITKAYQGYKNGGILKVTINYKHLLSANPNAFSINAVKTINKSQLANTNLFKKVYYLQNGRRITSITDIMKKPRRTTEEVLKERLKKIKKREKIQAINSAFNQLANYGLNKRSVTMLRQEKLGKYIVALNDTRSNKALETRLNQINRKLDKSTFSELQEARAMMSKAIKVREFANKLNPKWTPKTIEKELLAFFDEQQLTQKSSFGYFKDYNPQQDANKMINTYYKYFRNMNQNTLKAMEIWINPDEFYKKWGYNTTNLKSYIRGSVEGNYSSRGGSSWISWAVFIPPYPEAQKGLFLLKVKKTAGKSKRNPQLLYSFGELWGTPSISKSLFLKIFNDPEHMGTEFWRWYFRKYKKSSEWYINQNKKKR